MSYVKRLANFKERAMMLLSNQNGWSVCCRFKDQGLIESKPSELLPCTIYRATIKVKATVQKAKDVIAVIPGSKRLEWDSNLSEIRELEKLSETQWIQVSRTNSIAKGLISPREFVDICECEQTEDHCLITGGSIDYPELTSDDKYVRAINSCFGLKIGIDPSGEPGTVVVISFFESDIKGRLPRALIDATTPNFIYSCIGNWVKYLEQSGDSQI